MALIKSGIIGTGFIGPAHVEAVRRLGDVEMIALAELGDDLAKAKANLYSIPRAYGDYHDLLKDPEVQVVHICSPNTKHFQMVKEALAAGKHVICEKPLSMGTEESRELVRLAEQTDRITALDFNYRFYPLNQQAAAMVRSGEVGRIYAVHGSYLQDWLFLDTDYNWRIEPDAGGESRAVADVGSHWCDLIQFITGSKITSVFADLAVMIPVRKKPLKPIETYAGKELDPGDYEPRPITTEDYGTVLLRFDNGARGAFTVHQCAAGRKNRLYYEIDGSKCALAYDQEDPERLWIGRRDGPNRIMMRDPSILAPEARAIINYPGGHPEGYPDGLKQFVRAVYSAVKSGKKPVKPNYPTFADGHAEIALVEAVLRSHKTGGWDKVIY
ncbi:MAG: Gfo/Idh/MocA family oxidoreductase [Armatimonadetes bacterium]|nr:Gfo/Idh/MocA family oxidoreductase [Armatimonadota bacterium]